MTEPPSRPAGLKQFRGDPAIRGALFTQHRARSALDERIDAVFDRIETLMRGHGVFHAKLHFSSSRATLWLCNDPYRYRVHSLDELLGVDACLACPVRDYPNQAMVGPELIRPVLERFRELRYADEQIYLRAGSLNLINGLVGLNFSCDGSHYLSAAEFIASGREFWFG
jgi:hypothetical protein